MPRVAVCPQCKVKLKASDAAAGKRVKCPNCAAVLTIPAFPKSGGGEESIVQRAPPDRLNPSGAAAIERGESPQRQAASLSSSGSEGTPRNPLAKNPRYREQLLAALQERIEPVRRSLFYRLATLLVAVVMILLPVIYLLLIVGVGYAVYYHFINHSGMVAWRVGLYAWIVVVTAYIAPLIIGVVAVLFMIKPIFARPAHPPRTRNLTRQAEPLLFEFVGALCESIGSPRPSRIDVDVCVNASARFPRGILSMPGSELVLTIGTPLVAGLTLRQLTGVLAHEFGHFSQGIGMRLSYLIRSISGWFARVVYERDNWDVWLVETTSELDFRYGWVLAAAQLFVALSRGVLWCLMMIGAAVSGVLLRQMEYDADRYVARTVGGETFAAISKRLRDLVCAEYVLEGRLEQLSRQGVLADNYARLLMLTLDDIPDDVRELFSSSLDGKASIFDSHPTGAARIANIQKEHTPGVFQIDGRAQDLFVDFESISRGTTWDFYCGAIGRRIKPTDLVSVDTILASQTTPEDSKEELPTIPFDD